MVLDEIYKHLSTLAPFILFKLTFTMTKFAAKMPVRMPIKATVAALALAPLGDTAQVGSLLFVVASPTVTDL
jgi:hypothetical protein